MPILRHRPATADDLPTVVAIPQHADELFFCYPKGSWPFTVAQLSEAVDQREASTVVELDGKIAAFANFYTCVPGEYCALGNVMVAAWARGQGVAHYLIEQMEHIARERFSAREMQLSCFNANTAGLLLYPAMGYQVVGVQERRNHLGQRVALLQFRKPL
ncbi:GNAT family N-acetyltransferase [Pseudomonas turukhanskensis]|uniref:GNAT family N-acetyltransferase n=1 Tax=Pseudomonas turukhanskensis TaxID=1806536 RepID=A0A9W6KDF1_9PSED|nr:GNAT family N-acetyltransferase [Pseudomonas turukhanskensis]GLK91463.1 GNAT family N-acetyltransferase [Pseudomonas turukhanskensis]